MVDGRWPLVNRLLRFSYCCAWGLSVPLLLLSRLVRPSVAVSRHVSSFLTLEALVLMPKPCFVSICQPVLTVGVSSVDVVKLHGARAAIVASLLVVTWLMGVVLCCGGATGAESGGIIGDGNVYHLCKEVGGPIVDFCLCGWLESVHKVHDLVELAHACDLSYKVSEPVDIVSDVAGLPQTSDLATKNLLIVRGLESLLDSIGEGLPVCECTECIGV